MTIPTTSNDPRVYQDAMLHAPRDVGGGNSGHENGQLEDRLFGHDPAPAWRRRTKAKQAHLNGCNLRPFQLVHCPPRKRELFDVQIDVALTGNDAFRGTQSVFDERQ